MIVLDASVLIAHFNADDASHDRARELLLASAVQPLAASTITLAEVMVGPARAGKGDIAGEALRLLGVDEVPILPGAASKLAELRASTGLKLPDCCVLLAAKQTRAGALLTFDDRLTKRAQELGYRCLGAG